MKSIFSSHDYLVLDFDGVIADSIEECFVVGHNAFVNFSKQGRKIVQLEELDGRTVRECRRLRSYVRSGEDYVYIQLMLKERIPVSSFEAFDAFLERNASLKSVFFNLFYEERENLSREHPELWINLNPLYPGISRFLLTFAPKEKLLIITTKKIDYVYKILQKYGIPFPAENGHSAFGTRTKTVIITELLGKYDIPPSRFHFVDDQIDTLLKVRKTGIFVYMAAWGYNNDTQRNTARRLGIPILSLPQLYKQFTNPP